MSFGINCLLAKDLMTARPMASDLDELNKARREIEQGMQTEAETIFKQLSFSDENLPSAIALYHQEWHQGVIGIVAGRLKEKYHRPSIVFANAKEESYGELEDKEAGAVEDIELLEAIEDNAEIKGSARSIPGLHIRDLLEHISSQHPDLILKFGGHAMAAGLSIKKRDFDKFQQVFDQLAKKWLKEEDLIGVILSDGELALSELTLDFAEQLRNAGPWGQNFSEPLFDDTFTLIQQRIVGEKHLKITVQKQDQLFDGIIFNIDIKAWPNPQAKNVHLAYKLDVNEFRGKRTVQLMVEDISLA